MTAPAYERRLSIVEAVRLAAEVGYRISVGTFNAYSSIGAGPVYQLWRGRRLYLEADVREWALYNRQRTNERLALAEARRRRSRPSAVVLSLKHGEAR